MGTMMIEDRLAGASDDVYNALIASHEGLSDADSHALNARLVLLLANEVGDAARVKALFAEARASGERRKAEEQA